MAQINFVNAILLVTMVNLNLLMESRGENWNFQCTSLIERHVHEQFCSRYYDCAEDDNGDQIIYLKSCTTGRIFNETAGKCQIGECPTETTEPDPCLGSSLFSGTQDWDFQCRSENERYQHKNYCNRFYMCRGEDDIGNLLTEVHTCQEFRKFDELVQRCVSGTCETSSPPPCDSTTTETPMSETPETETLATETPAPETTATETPDTETPSTETPATETPNTEAPATETANTEPPTAEAPTTEASTTEVPTTEAPTTEAPTTEAPTTEGPTTEGPTTEPPTTEAPTTEGPTTEGPTTAAPTTEAPTTSSPAASTQAPTPTPPFKCDRESGAFPHPENCVNYYLCHNFQETLHTCGNLFFDPDYETCRISCQYCWNPGLCPQLILFKDFLLKH